MVATAAVVAATVVLVMNNEIIKWNNARGKGTHEPVLAIEEEGDAACIHGDADETIKSIERACDHTTLGACTRGRCSLDGWVGVV